MAYLFDAIMIAANTDSSADVGPMVVMAVEKAGAAVQSSALRSRGVWVGS